MMFVRTLFQNNNHNNYARLIKYKEYIVYILSHFLQFEVQQSQKVDIGNRMNQKIFALCTLHSPRYIEGLKNVEENLNPLA